MHTCWILFFDTYAYSILQMVLFNVAFFGTGNFASIASFEISSVYRFITIFSVRTGISVFIIFVNKIVVYILFNIFITY